MNTAEDQDQFEKTRAEQIVADTPPLIGIESVTVELGEDHTGDPAMWLVFRMKNDLRPDDDWFRLFNKYTQELGMRIIRSGLSRFPYTRLKEAA